MDFTDQSNKVYIFDLNLPNTKTMENFFWESIEKSNQWTGENWKEYDPNEHIKSLTNLLSTSDKESLIQFEKTLQEKLNVLYTKEIAELYFILDGIRNTINFDGYLSEDGFIYFRCWLLLKGKDFFEEITRDINLAISERYPFPIEEIWAEGLLYISDKAYALHHENEDLYAIQDAVEELYPDVIHFDSMDNEMEDEPAYGEELEAKYPELIAKAIARKGN